MISIITIRKEMAEFQGTLRFRECPSAAVLEALYKLGFRGNIEFENGYESRVSAPITCFLTQTIY